jgi:shikimate dehydrogenase
MKVFGLIGERLSHSLSPIIHHYVYEILDLEASYSLYQVQPSLLGAAVQGIRALNLSGVNVTIPYKIKIMEYLDNISTEAQKIGAVNTIFNDASVLKGFNTDYIGFGRLLDKHLIQPGGKRAVILGSGGAAKSVSTYLEDSGVSDLYVVSRKPEEVNRYNNYEVISYEQLSLIKQGYLLINCTPIGMYPVENAVPIPQAEVSKFENVVDLIYNPSNTQLMKSATGIGIPAYNGLYMLVSQAIAAIEIWYSISIAEDIVDEVYQKLIQYIDRVK